MGDLMNKLVGEKGEFDFVFVDGVENGDVFAEEGDHMIFFVFLQKRRVFGKSKEEVEDVEDGISLGENREKDACGGEFISATGGIEIVDKSLRMYVGADVFTKVKIYGNTGGIRVFRGGVPCKNEFYFL